MLSSAKAKIINTIYYVLRYCFEFVTNVHTKLLVFIHDI